MIVYSGLLELVTLGFRLGLGQLRKITFLVSSLNIISSNFIGIQRADQFIVKIRECMQWKITGWSYIWVELLNYGYANTLKKYLKHLNQTNRRCIAL